MSFEQGNKPPDVVEKQSLPHGELLFVYPDKAVGSLEEIGLPPYPDLVRCADVVMSNGMASGYRISIVAHLTDGKFDSQCFLVPNVKEIDGDGVARFEPTNRNYGFTRPIRLGRRHGELGKDKNPVNITVSGADLGLGEQASMSREQLEITMVDGVIHIRNLATENPIKPDAGKLEITRAVSGHEVTEQQAESEDDVTLDADTAKELRRHAEELRAEKVRRDAEEEASRQAMLVNARADIAVQSVPVEDKKTPAEKIDEAGGAESHISKADPVVRVAADIIKDQIAQINDGDGVVHEVKLLPAEEEPEPPDEKQETPAERIADTIREAFSDPQKLLDSLNSKDQEQNGETIKALRAVVESWRISKIAGASKEAWDTYLKPKVEALLPILDAEAEVRAKLVNAVGDFPQKFTQFCSAIEQSDFSRAGQINQSYGIWRNLDTVVGQFREVTKHDNQRQSAPVEAISEEGRHLVSQATRNQYSPMTIEDAMECINDIQALGTGEDAQALREAFEANTKSIGNWRQLKDFVAESVQILDKGISVREDIHAMMETVARRLEDYKNFSVGNPNRVQHNPTEMRAILSVLQTVMNEYESTGAYTKTARRYLAESLE